MKRGDKVKYIKENTYGREDKLELNNTYTVRRVSTDNSSIETEEGRVHYWIPINCFQLVKEENTKIVPERISFYVRYTEEFTKDLFNELWKWSKENSNKKAKNLDNTYEGLKIHKYYLFDNWGFYQNKWLSSTELHSYGVDNNPQSCQQEVSIKQVKKLINYNELIIEKISKEEDKNFKEGDILIIDNLYDGSIGEIGHIFQLKSIENNYYYPIIEDYIVGGCWIKPCLKKANSSEIELYYNKKYKHLLDLAKEKYPIGTEYIPLNEDGILGSIEKAKVNKNPILINNCGIDVGFGYIYSFKTNKWAEIISSKEKEIKKYEYIVVHCKTQEEWDFVNSKLDKKARYNSTTWQFYKEYSCKNINGAYDSLSYYQRLNSLIYSFEDWCKLNSYIIPFNKPIDKLILKEKILGNGFSINEKVLYKNRTVIIKGFHKEKNYCVIIEDGKSGHKGRDTDYWLDEYGNNIYNTRKDEDIYWFVKLNELKKIDKQDLTTSVLENSTLIDTINTTTNHFPINIELLKVKEDKRLDTSVNKIESVKTNLKQKSKLIKF